MTEKTFPHTKPSAWNLSYVNSWFYQKMWFNYKWKAPAAFLRNHNPFLINKGIRFCKIPGFTSWNRLLQKVHMGFNLSDCLIVQDSCPLWVSEDAQASASWWKVGSFVEGAWWNPSNLLHAAGSQCLRKQSSSRATATFHCRAILLSGYFISPTPGILLIQEPETGEFCFSKPPNTIPKLLPWWFWADLSCAFIFAVFYILEFGSDLIINFENARSIKRNTCDEWEKNMKTVALSYLSSNNNILRGSVCGCMMVIE